MLIDIETLSVLTRSLLRLFISHFYLIEIKDSIIQQKTSQINLLFILVVKIIQ